MPTFGPRISTSPYFSSSPFEPTLPAVTHLSEIDLTDPDLYLRGDPHAAFRLLREQAPVFRHESGVAMGYGGAPFWVVSTYEGFTQVLRDAKTFATEGTSLDVEVGDAGLFTAAGEEHRAWRSAVSALTGKTAISAVEDRLHAVVSAHVGALADSGRMDVAEFATALPPELFAAFLDVDSDGADQIRRLHLWEDETPEGYGAKLGLEAQTIDGWLRHRAEHPVDDIFQTLLRTEDAGKLTRAQTMAYLFGIFEASYLGTRSAIQNTLIALLHHPDQFARLRSEPEIVDDGRAVEELLRWAGHSMHVARRATTDTEIMGQPIKAGDVVVSWQASANRDENVFESPYLLDLGRPKAGIMSFSTGIHQCLGQFYIRSVLTSLLSELSATFAELRQAGAMERTLAGGTILATFVTSLPIELQPARALILVN